MVAEKVVVQLILDTSGYSSKAVGAARSTAKIQTEASKTAKAAAGLTGSLKKLGFAFGAAFATKAVLNFAKQSIAAFSNLEESVNAVNVVYGEAAEGVHKLGEDSVEQFGLSTRAVNDAAVGLGAFVEKINAADPANAFENIIQRATDFASVMNITTDEALDKFRAGLSGESEPLKRFGINVSEANVKLFALETGLIVSGEAMDEATKIQARFGFIMQETAKTAGDFANTSDGLAGSQKKLAAQWEEMQATIGEELEPAMIKMLSASVKLIPVFAAVARKIASLVDEVSPLIDALIFVVDVVGEVGDAGDELDATSTNWMEDFTARSQELRTSTIPGVIGIFGELINRFGDTDAAAVIFIDDLDDMAVAERFAGTEAKRLARLGLEVEVSLDNQRTATDKAGVAAQTAAERFQTQADAMRDVASAAAEAASPILRAIRAQESKTKADLALIEVNKDVEASDADRLEAALAVVDAQITLDVANASLIGGLEEARSAFIEEATAAGFANDEIQKMVDLLFKLPTTVDVELILTTTGQFERVEQLLRGGRQGGSLRPVPKRHGGPVAADEPFIVGEGGPELFIPDRAGRIIPNNSIGGQSIVVNVNDSTTTDLAADLSAGLIAAQITQQVEMLRI